jgi:hypothetical protein
MHGDLGLKAALQQASPGRWFYVTTLSPGDTLASELMAVGERTFTGLGQGKQHIPSYTYDGYDVCCNMFHMTNIFVLFLTILQLRLQLD